MNSKLLTTLAITTAFSWTALADLELGDASKLPPAAAKTGVTYEKDRVLGNFHAGLSSDGQ